MATQTTQSEMSLAEFGRFLGSYGAGMSRQAVSKSQVIPKILRNGRPVVPVAEALRALEAAGRISLDQPAMPAATVDLLPPPEEPAKGGRPKAAAGGGGGYYEEKALTERVTREIQEIKLAQLRGELVRTADVTEALTDAGRRIGERLEQIATVAGEIAAAAREGGEQAVREILRRQVRGVREGLADELSRAIGAAPDDDGEDAGDEET